MEHKLEFIQPGLYTSLQDQGRTLGRNWGVPQGGAMDQLSARRANLKLNNAPNLPVLEITGIGPTLRSYGNGQLALAGASIAVFQNNQKLNHPELINFKDGDILKFGNTTEGFRTYLSIRNGFQTKPLFGSVSLVAGISPALRFKKGDLLYFESSSPLPTTNARLKNPLLFQDKTILTMAGPEYDLLSKGQQSILKNATFTISPTASRMAYSLTPKIDAFKHSISLLTSPVVPGVVQLTPAGQLIVLMRDAQTTGGYPRVLVVTEAGLDRLGQMRGGEELVLRTS